MTAVTLEVKRRSREQGLRQESLELRAYVLRLEAGGASQRDLEGLDRQRWSVIRRRRASRAARRAVYA